MPDVIPGSFLHIPVCGGDENIAAGKPVGGVPDSHFGTESSAAGAGFSARKGIRFLTKCQQMPAEYANVRTVEKNHQISG
ncbi:MAG: hypothetical protein LBH60_08770 [Prevotellaceae bacterium]|jgi:hypothetical protein|nr:hypothetical protein [Prevotellaceae bacterium]